MGRLLLRRALGYLVLLVVASSCGYLLAATALNPRASYEEQRPAPPPATVEALLSEYNLNDRDPLAARYATWAGGVVHGDLGRTWDGASVNAEMGRRVLVSLRLMTLGFVVGVAVGVLAAVWAVSARRGRVDAVVSTVAVVLISVPTVVLAVVLQTAGLWLNAATGLDLVRATGETTPGGVVGFWPAVADRLSHLVLPTLTIALPLAAIVSRYQRNLLLDTAHADFVRTARAKGLTRRAAILRHALRVAFVPMVARVGYTFALLFTGVVFAEAVFGWYGVGMYLIDSVGRGDVNAVAAVCVFTAGAVAVVALLGDVAQALLDPRIRSV